ncbi:MAG: hypothetical protein ACHQ53_17470 [Polyangiales bacterium]
MKSTFLGMVVAFALCSPLRAYAQEESGGDEAAASGDESKEQAGGDKGGEPAGTDTAKPSEGSRNWSFGPYLRMVVVPSFMLKLFSDMAPSPFNVGFGVAATYRTDDGSPNFEMGLGYTSYGFHGPFRTKGGDANDTEWWDSSLGMVHLTGSVLWEAKLIGDKLGLQYGLGLDLGVVTGSLVRTEAYQPAGSSAWVKCPAPLYGPTCQLPMVGYDVKGEQYNVKQGNVPPVMAVPMLPRLGLRFAPIEDLWVRLDMAYGIFQFWFGLSAAYVPKL